MKKFKVSNDVWTGNTISIAMIEEIVGVRSYASCITTAPYIIGSMVPNFLTLSQEEAQELVNSLYALGIHPAQSKGSAGQLEAVKYHLEDMRKLVLK